MSWKGSLEITYSFFQRIFYFHLQTLSGDVESEVAAVSSHEGEKERVPHALLLTEARLERQKEKRWGKRVVAVA